ncbi:DNA circularization protein [Luteimonas soli]|uniref:DNA circularization protein n=1 Tax=Luteimonas soli TaxID=1648966 RepID=A0ABV7XKV7_9GAMM
MSWRDQLRRASFRGVEFHTVSDSATFGRRTVLHEFPFRDLPYSEDLGRKAREIRIVGFVLGDDYLTTLDSLIAAIEQAGPGKLVHPKYGELTVSISGSGVTVEQTDTEGGMARINFACIESGEARFPASQVATQDVLKAVADDGKRTAIAGFLSRFSLDNLPAWAQELSINRARAFLDQVRNVIGPIAGVASGRGSVLGLLDALSPDLGSLLRNGMAFTNEIGNLVDTMRIGLDGRTAVRVFGGLASIGQGEAPLPLTTATRRRDAQCRAALIPYLQASVAIERARAVADIEFTDYEDAVAVRDSVVAQIDTVADTTTDDRVFDALSALRAAVVRDIAARGADLARLVAVTPVTTLPALVLAHRLYQDATLEADILARNRIVHPGFVPAGHALEVPVNG